MWGRLLGESPGAQPQAAKQNKTKNRVFLFPLFQCHCTGCGVVWCLPEILALGRRGAQQEGQGPVQSPPPDRMRSSPTTDTLSQSNGEGDSCSTIFFLTNHILIQESKNCGPLTVNQPKPPTRIIFHLTTVVLLRRPVFVKKCDLCSADWPQTYHPPASVGLRGHVSLL